MKVKKVYSGENKTIEPNALIGYSFICPGCGHDHTINIDRRFGRSVWGFNGDTDNPTFTPSLLVKSGWYVNPDLYERDKPCSYQCHSFITNGKIQFLGDCTHSLKNQTIELPEIKEV